MQTNVWNKKYTQTVIKALRQSGYEVVKSNSGYTCERGSTLIFKAMKGVNGYLVRYNENVITNG